MGAAESVGFGAAVMSVMIGNVPEAEFANAQRLVEIMAARWYAQNKPRCPPGWDADDARAAALHGLVMAAQRFDATKGFKFNTYAGSMALGYVRKQLRDFAPVAKDLKRMGTWGSGEFPLEFDRPNGDEDSVRFGDLWADDAPGPESLVLADFPEGLEVDQESLWQAVDALKAPQGPVLRLRFQEGKTLRETAECLGYSHEGIRQLLERALRNLKHALETGAIVPKEDMMTTCNVEIAAEPSAPPPPPSEAATPTTRERLRALIEQEGRSLSDPPGAQRARWAEALQVSESYVTAMLSKLRSEQREQEGGGTPPSRRVSVKPQHPEPVNTVTFASAEDLRAKLERWRKVFLELGEMLESALPPEQLEEKRPVTVLVRWLLADWQQAQRTREAAVAQARGEADRTVEAQAHSLEWQSQRNEARAELANAHALMDGAEIAAGACAERIAQVLEQGRECVAHRYVLDDIEARLNAAGAPEAPSLPERLLAALERPQLIPGPPPYHRPLTKREAQSAADVAYWAIGEGLEGIFDRDFDLPRIAVIMEAAAVTVQQAASLQADHGLTLTDADRDEALQLLYTGGEFSVGFEEIKWRKRGAILRLAADMADMAAIR